MNDSVKYRCGFCHKTVVGSGQYVFHTCEEKQAYDARLAEIDNPVPAPASGPR